MGFARFAESFDRQVPVFVQDCEVVFEKAFGQESVVAEGVQVGQVVFKARLSHRKQGRVSAKEFTFEHDHDSAVVPEHVSKGQQSRHGFRVTRNALDIGADRVALDGTPVEPELAVGVDFFQISCKYVDHDAVHKLPFELAVYVDRANLMGTRCWQMSPGTVIEALDLDRGLSKYRFVLVFEQEIFNNNKKPVISNRSIQPTPTVSIGIVQAQVVVSLNDVIVDAVIFEVLVCKLDRLGFELSNVVARHLIFRFQRVDLSLLGESASFETLAKRRRIQPSQFYLHSVQAVLELIDMVDGRQGFETDVSELVFRHRQLHFQLGEQVVMGR
jgi:hypothetical protein